MNTLSKTIQINNIKFLKTKTPSTLFSSICNLNEEKGQKQNIVPLSRLFKSKIKIKFEPKKQINYINLKKTINNKKIFHRSMKNTALNNYKSLSYNMLPFKHSNIKLPKIKTQEENNSGELGSILNKFDKYDDKFKQQSMRSIDVGNIGFLRYKFNKGFNNNFKFSHETHRKNYKKAYSKLFKRIKEIKSLY